MVRGAQAGEKDQVKTITDGVIHKSIRCGADLLRCMGVANISTPGAMSIDIVTAARAAGLRDKNRWQWACLSLSLFIRN